MRLAVAGACLAFLLLTISASALQQPPTAKGSIEGAVTRAGTGDPIPGARVTLTRMGGVLPMAAALHSTTTSPGRIADASLYIQNGFTTLSTESVRLAEVLHRFLPTVRADLQFGIWMPAHIACPSAPMGMRSKSMVSVRREGRAHQSI